MKQVFTIWQKHYILNIVIIQFKKKTHIRLKPSETGNEPIGFINRRSIIEVKAKQVNPRAPRETPPWYVDQKGWCYWGGEVVELTEEQAGEKDDYYGGSAATYPYSEEVIPGKVHLMIKLKKRVRIRRSPSDDDKAIGVLFKDNILAVEPLRITGEELKGNPIWYKDPRGWFFWGGAVEELAGGDIQQEDPYPTGEEEPETGEYPPSVDDPEKESPGYEPTEEPELPEEDPYPTGEEEPETGEYPPNVDDPEKESPGYEPDEVPEIPEVEPDTSYGEQEDSSGYDVETPVAEPVHDYEYDPEKMNWGLDKFLLIEHFWNNCGLLGEGIKVALLDTGVDTNHPDLKDAIAGGRNFTGPDRDNYEDEDGHGTCCAGLIAATGERKVYGAAPKAKLYIGKIISKINEEINMDLVFQGIQWALNQHVDIILLGFDFKKSSVDKERQELLKDYIDHTTKKRGVLFIGPAGNSSDDKPEGRYISNLENCLSVGASNRSNRRLPNSIRSFTLDVLAPGEDLITTGKGGRVEHFSGTHAAAAFMTGCMALVIDFFNLNNLPYGGKDLLRLTRKSADPKMAGNDQRDYKYGFGIISPIGLTFLGLRKNK